jgi:hypothetical protein
MRFSNTPFCVACWPLWFGEFDQEDQDRFPWVSGPVACHICGVETVRARWVLPEVRETVSSGSADPSYPRHRNRVGRPRFGSEMPDFPRAVRKKTMVSCFRPSVGSGYWYWDSDRRGCLHIAFHSAESVIAGAFRFTASPALVEYLLDGRGR